MGLPKTFQTVQLDRSDGADHDETQLQRAQLWESLCAADRLFGMAITLPPGTRRYQLGRTTELIIDGTIQPRTYLRSLADITTRIQDLDEMSTAQTSKGLTYAFALKIDAELKELASQTPRSWWAEDVEPVKADHVLRFLHSCITMRAHLPFTMQQDPGDEYIYSRITCIDACESVVTRYLFLRQRIPSGIFICQIMDLQAFTATVVLLLTSYNSASMERLNLKANETRIKGAVAQVVELMDRQSKKVTSSNVIRHGVTTIRSLQTLLQQDGNSSPQEELSLKVPLLGNVRVRRKDAALQASRPSNPQSFPVPPESSSWNSNLPFTSQPFGRTNFDSNDIAKTTGEPQGDWHLDPLSWSIEDQDDNFFQDDFMAESFDQNNIWQNIQNSVQFGSGDMRREPTLPL
jgi:hypothetical protein